MHFAGFAVAPTASVAQATAETRAVYGGLFVVLGVWIVYAALRGARQLLVLAGTLFLGAASGRLGGAYVAGSPGLWGWIGAVIEVALGVALLSASWSLGREEEWPVLATHTPPAQPIPGAPSEAKPSPPSGPEPTGPATLS